MTYCRQKKYYNFSIIPAFLALFVLMLSSGCGGCGQSDSAFFKSDFYTLTPRPVWQVFEYHGELRKETGSFRYALFQKSPVKIEKWSDEDGLEYGLILCSYFDSRIKPGEFKYVESVAVTSNMEVIKDDFPNVSGLLAHHFEAHIKSTSMIERTYNLVISIPVASGYVELRAWCPEGNNKLIDEFKEIANTLYISDSDYFKKNPQDDPWRIKQ